MPPSTPPQLPAFSAAVVRGVAVILRPRAVFPMDPSRVSIPRRVSGFWDVAPGLRRKRRHSGGVFEYRPLDHSGQAASRPPRDRGSAAQYAEIRGDAAVDRRDTGGLVGICCIPNFLGRGGDIAALLDHVDYVVTRFGIDHVAIGTDVSHTSQHASAPGAKFPTRGKRRDRFEALWPPNALGGQWPQSASLGWTNWPLFTVGLVQRGYTDEKIPKILGEKILRVCRAVMVK